MSTFEIVVQDMQAAMGGVSLLHVALAGFLLGVPLLVLRQQRRRR